ncbi:MAG TPA: Zn-dependent hydrolase [Gemmatimonadaceae bacterium]|nr:Zn-dependent hydrolase [Gemmatimonadaceae bacterium]
MNRREFSASLLSAVVAMRTGRHSAQTAPVKVNGARLNAHLAELMPFGANPQGGISRVAYSDADKAAREVVMQWMREARLAPSIDFAGNIIGRRGGTDASLKPLMFGSHIDSVPEGGNYDGTLGSTGAIEVAQSLAERAMVLRHPIEVVIWANEEGGLYGSRAVSGQLTAPELKNVSNSRKTIEEGIAFLGGDPTKLDQIRRKRGDIAGYFELHIEQGGVLEQTSTAVGIVEGIVGIRQWEVTVTGFQNHAGTTPMDQRHDALLSAARFADMVNRVVRAMPGRQVGTVGKMQPFPGAPNVIPGKVICSLELRDLDDAKIATLYQQVTAEARKIGEANGTTFEYRSLHENVAAPSDARMRSFVGDSAKALGLSTRVMPSGAGHDAQAMAQLGPMGMIFIPSIGGISHSPKEFSKPEDCVNGANVLMGAVLAADAALDGASR